MTDGYTLNGATAASFTVAGGNITTGAGTDTINVQSWGQGNGAVTKYGSGTLILRRRRRRPDLSQRGRGNCPVEQDKQRLAERACGDHDYGHCFRRHRAADGDRRFPSIPGEFDHDYRRYL